VDHFSRGRLLRLTYYCRILTPLSKAVARENEYREQERCHFTEA
jgi:hypothetical protein